MLWIRHEISGTLWTFNFFFFSFCDQTFRLTATFYASNIGGEQIILAASTNRQRVIRIDQRSSSRTQAFRVVYVRRTQPFFRVNRLDYVDASTVRCLNTIFIRAYKRSNFPLYRVDAGGRITGIFWKKIYITKKKKKLK